MNGVTIGIIGGSGRMGVWFKRLFEELGHSVLVSGRNTALSCAHLARRSDVVVLSVPVSVVDSICSEIGPLMGSAQLLMDICSLKESVLKSMLAVPAVQVVGTHPLFGPSAESLMGQNVVICPGRGADRLEWLEAQLRAGGAVLSRMDPVEHDRQMALVQGLTHFLTITLGRTLQKLALRPQDAMKVATPVFRIQLDMIGRLFAQDLELYRDLIGSNRHAESTLNCFLAAVDETRRSLVANGSGAAAIELMENIRGFLNDFCDQGYAESSRFMNALYDESRG